MYEHENLLTNVFILSQSNVCLNVDIEINGYEYFNIKDLKPKVKLNTCVLLSELDKSNIDHWIKQVEINKTIMKGMKISSA